MHACVLGHHKQDGPIQSTAVYTICATACSTVVGAVQPLTDHGITFVRSYFRQLLSVQVYSPHYGTKPAYSQSSAHAASAPNTAFTPYPAVFPLSLPSPYIPTVPYTSSSPSTASITHVVPSHHAVPPPFFASTPHAAAANPLTPTADPSVAYVPGSFVAGVPFETLPLYHQNFILKAATHCWKDQYAELQLDNNKLRAGLASSQGQHASLEERLQLLEEQLETQRQWKTAVDSASHDE